MKTKFDKSRVSLLLQTLRREKNVTQAAIAEKLGFSDKTYSRWETVDALPDLEALSLLAGYFGVSPSLFFDESASGGVEDIIHRMYDGLSPTEQVEKLFEILFHAIRGIAQNSFDDVWKGRHWKESLSVKPPENRVFRCHNAKTGISFDDVYAMMYNGSDANIALSVMPHEENYAWLTEERDRLSSLLALLADRDMLALLPKILSKDFSPHYTAEYAAKCAGVDGTRAAALLAEAQRLGLCAAEKSYIGDSEVTVYSPLVEHTLTGLLILCHLILNREKTAGYVTINAPGKITCAEEGGKKHELR